MSIAAGRHRDGSARQARNASISVTRGIEGMISQSLSPAQAVRRCEVEPRLAVRIGPLELAQKTIAAFDGGIKCGLRGFLAAERLLQLIVDRVPNQHKRAEPDAPGILRGRFQRDL